MNTEPPLPVMPRTFAARVLESKRLSPFGYELRLERLGLSFQAGQLINVHGKNRLENRSYTICSGERDEELRILYRYIPGGVLTPQLIERQPGDHVTVSGPYGEFVLRDTRRPIYFFATGTGIAPCRAYLRTHPDLDLTLIHGVRDPADLYYRNDLPARRYIPCVSGPHHDPAAFGGRVTGWAATNVLPPDAHYYLCGANEMIYEMRECLEQSGIPREHVFSEEYYYRMDDA
ncbi:MAG TPA: FAD-binding oxidoreductase [Kiritimatiellia bacterium]|nr:FAD-binding oxidoreductase [Kiritimatiellia bacterium]